MTTELDSLSPSVGPLPPAGDLATARPALTNLQPSTCNLQPGPSPEVKTLDFKPRRRRGPQSKIAQLPAEQRNLVNQLLDDDNTYEQVVEEMAMHGVSLNTDNVFK